jgi:hypothetical protein
MENNSFFGTPNKEIVPRLIWEPSTANKGLVNYVANEFIKIALVEYPWFV